VIASAIVILAVAVAGGWLRRGGKSRNRRIAEWAQTITLSLHEADAMWKLWQAGLSKRPPKQDPLAGLSTDEMAHILQVCGASYRPREFGDASAFRLASFRHLADLGFSEHQAAILVGMMFNMVGRRDLQRR
jgi:hypothetical protein